MSDGDRFVLDIAPYLGKPEAWKQHLIEVIDGARDSMPVDVARVARGPDSCEIQ